MSSSLPVQLSGERRKAIPAYFFPPLSPEDDVGVTEVARWRKGLQAAGERQRTLVYVHIPFCQSHCSFCSFYRKTLHQDDELLSAYVERVLDELDLWVSAGALEWAHVEAIYIGGGSPSVLPPALARRLVEGMRRLLPLAPEAEISFEGEVRTLKRDGLVAALREAGVTRISYGVQSFNPEVRRAAGIAASLEDVRECAATLHRFGYPICLDLMYGLPGQTVEVFAEDLRAAADRDGAVLLDLYGIVLYPTAPLLSGANRDARRRLPDTTCRDAMYEHAMDALAQRGFEQLTFEDFCLPDGAYRMKDLTYGGDDGRTQTLALGACAVGYFGGCAYRNPILEKYLEAPRSELPIDRLRRASADEQRRRVLFFYPRRLVLDPRQLATPLTGEERSMLDGHVNEGLAARDAEGRYTLTRRGRVRADDLVRGFLLPEEQRRLLRLLQ